MRDVTGNKKSKPLPRLRVGELTYSHKPFYSGASSLPNFRGRTVRAFSRKGLSFGGTAHGRFTERIFVSRRRCGTQQMRLRDYHQSTITDQGRKRDQSRRYGLGSIHTESMDATGASVNGFKSCRKGWG